MRVFVVLLYTLSLATEGVSAIIQRSGNDFGAPVTALTTQTQTFQFTTSGDSTMQIPNCSPITFSLTTTSNSTQVVAPFSLTVLSANLQVANVSVPELTFPYTGSFTFNLTVGATVTFFWSDSRGHSGGARGPYTVTTGPTAHCTPSTTTVSGFLDLELYYYDNTTSRTAFCDFASFQTNYFVSPSAPGTMEAYVIEPALNATGSIVSSGLLTVNAFGLFVNLGAVTTPGSSSYIYVSGGVFSSYPVPILSGVGTSTCPNTVRSSSSTTATPTRTSTTPPATSSTGTPNNHHSAPAGAIAGGVVGGLVAIALIIFVGFVLGRRSRGDEKKERKTRSGWDGEDMAKPGAVVGGGGRRQGGDIVMPRLNSPERDDSVMHRSTAQTGERNENNLNSVSWE